MIPVRQMPSPSGHQLQMLTGMVNTAKVQGVKIQEREVEENVISVVQIAGRI